MDQTDSPPVTGEQSGEHDDDVFQAAVDAAMEVFDRHLSPAVPPRHVVAEALHDAGEVYEEARHLAGEELLSQVGLAGIDVDHGIRVKLVGAYGLLAGMVDAFKTLFDVPPGAINYLEQTIKPAGTLDTYTIIVVKPGGQTPHALRQQAEAELVAARTAGAQALAWAADEYRRCIVAARVPHDDAYYAKVNGRAEAYRQLGTQLAAALGIPAPDWNQIKTDVPRDGIYRDKTESEPQSCGGADRLHQHCTHGPLRTKGDNR